MNRDDGGTMDWKTLEAGREMDALVAERVMGLQDVHRDGCYWVHRVDGLSKILPHFTATLGGAWAVVDRMAEHSNAHLRTLHMVVYPYRRTYATFEHERYESGDGWAEGNGEHHTPLAICRAALAAVGSDGWTADDTDGT